MRTWTDWLPLPPHQETIHRYVILQLQLTDVRGHRVLQDALCPGKQHLLLLAQHLVPSGTADLVPKQQATMKMPSEKSKEISSFNSTPPNILPT